MSAMNNMAAMNTLAHERLSSETRRTFLSRQGLGLGAVALAMLTGQSAPVLAE